MGDDPGDSRRPADPPSGGSSGAAARRERLAVALRSNLKRRKTQVRARQAKEGGRDTPPGDGD
jgi:hypothetical protein